MTIKLQSGQCVFYRTRSREAQKALERVVRILIARKIPFEIVFN